MKWLTFLLLFSTNILAQNNLDDYTLAELDSLFVSAQKPQEKLTYALAALKKSEKELDIKDTTFARKLYTVGDLYIDVQDLSNAQKYLEQALGIYEEKGVQNIGYIEALQALGVVFYNKGDYDKAEGFYLKGLDLAEKITGKKHYNYASITSSLGRLYEAMGIYDKSEYYYLQALNLFEEIYGDTHQFYFNSLNNLGVLYKKIGAYEKAEQYYLKALKLNKEVLGDDHAPYAGALNNLGILYRDMGEYDKSEQYYLESLDLNKELFGEKHPEYAVALNNSANLYILMGDYEKAEQYYLQAWDIMKEVLGERHPTCASVHYGLGDVYFRNELYEKAEKVYLAVLDVFGEALGEKHPYYGLVLNSLGNTYMEMEDYVKAEEFHLKAFKIQQEKFGDKHPDNASFLSSLGDIYMAMNSYDKAEESYLQALGICEGMLGKKHPNYIESLNNLAVLYEKNNQDSLVWKMIKEAIFFNTDIIITSDIPTAMVDNLSGASYISFYEMDKSLWILYQLWAKQDKRQEQLLITNLALQLLERTKNELSGEEDKLRMLEQSAQWVEVSMQLLDSDQEAEMALGIVEQNKSVLLLDASSTKRAYASGLLPDSLILKEKELAKQYTDTKAAMLGKRSEAELDSIRGVLNTLNVEIDAFQKAIEEDYPKYAAMKYSHNAIGTNEVQSLLDEKTALLEYFVGDSAIYTICITKTEAKLYEVIIDKKTLNNRVKMLHNALSNYELISNQEELAYQQYTEQAYWFYQKLVEPVYDQIKGLEALLVVTDGVLGHLPFETFLLEEAPENGNYNELHYLVKDYQISYNYSASLWKENKESRAKNNNGELFAIAANYALALDSNRVDLRSPVDRRLRQRLSPLPAARKEVEVLQQLYQGFFAFDSVASESLFKAQAAEYAVIHMAMHGLLNRKEQVLSSLAFTEISDSVENNFLHAYEISKMELNADLVVLSACETGYGKFEKGNGIASLARAFMYAGVSAMVVSLWEVNDASTSQIMQFFYENLATGMQKDAALRQAKLDYIQATKGRSAHPAYWSPFIQIGNTKEINIQKKGAWNSWLVGGGCVVVLFCGMFLVSRRRKEAA